MDGTTSFGCIRNNYLSILLRAAISSIASKKDINKKQRKVDPQMKFLINFCMSIIKKKKLEFFCTDAFIIINFTLHFHLVFFFSKYSSFFGINRGVLNFK